MKKWRTVSQSMAFDTKWFKVRCDEVENTKGQIIDDYYVWENNDIAFIVPITTEGKFVFVEQYKHAIQEIMLEYPAGFVDKADINHLEACKRELAEETGYTTSDWEKLATLTNSPTKENGRIHVYLATNCKKTNETKFDENEEIKTHELSLEEVLEKIQTGKIWVSATIASTFLVIRKLKLSV